jgi:hypothetical protein
MTSEEADKKLLEVATNLIKGLETSKLADLHDYLTLLQAFKEITGRPVSEGLVGSDAAASEACDQAEEQLKKTAEQLIEGLTTAVAGGDKKKIKDYLKMLQQLKDIIGQNPKELLKERLRIRRADY